MADKAETDWIEWASPLSNVPPVDPLTTVEVRFIDGGNEYTDTGAADLFYWKSDGDCDIIAYRVVSS